MIDIKQTDIHNAKGIFEIFMFNVGQGDHFMLKFPDGEYGVIDFHYASSKSIVEPPALSYFKSLATVLSESEMKKITIAFICISHTDHDHIKGQIETVEWFYKNGIFIREFWLSAARDEVQMMHLLKNKLTVIVNNASDAVKKDLSINFSHFTDDVDSFYSYFDRWRKKKFRSARYEVDPVGNGEYLVDIRPLRKPGSMNCSALNIGPLGTHLDEFVKNLSIDVIRRIIGKATTPKLADKNLLSHILLLKFGETNILFGGDTNKEIWEDCLDRYHDSNYEFLQMFGPLDARFIKVSHHGSKFSSSGKIWKNCLPVTDNVFLGISAGKHLKYKHPDSETIADIRDVRKDAAVFSTNACRPCVLGNSFPKEYHEWYDDQVLNAVKYKKEKMNSYDISINQSINLHRKKKKEKHELGLFAYIFEIPDSNTAPIKVRTALTKINAQVDHCFYKEHTEKLSDKCS